jgi:hypothetical protein
VAEPDRLCQNCRTPLLGAFCHVCGQRDAELRVAIWRLVGQLAAEAFEADGKLVRTLPTFVLRPGDLVRGYVRGQRARYTSPVRILVFALAMGFLCMGFGANRSLDQMAGALEDRPFVLADGVARISPEGGGGLSISVNPGSNFEAGLRQLDGMNQRQAARLLLGGALDVAPTVVLLLIPAFTLLLELLYPRFLVIEHLLLSALLHAQGLILLGVAAVVGSAWVEGAVLLWLHGQLLLSIKGVYEQSWMRTIAKFLVVLVGYWLLLLAAFVVTMLLMLQGL